MSLLRTAFASPAMDFASPLLPGSRQAAAPTRRGLVFAAVLAFHALLLWAIVTTARIERPLLPTFMQVMLIPQTPSPQEKPAPVLQPMPPLRTWTPAPALIEPPQVEIAREPSAPAQPLVSPPTPPRPDAITSATTVATEPAPTAPVRSVAPAATPAAPPPAPAPVATAAPQPVIIPPSAIQYLQMPVVVYPSLSKRRRESGLVIVSTLVDKEGRPGQTLVQQSSGFDRLDEAAIAAVRQARFKPYMQAGQATAGWVRIPITFELEN